MTPEGYIAWVDQEIALCDRVLKHTTDADTRNFLNGKKNGLYDAKHQFAIFIATQEPSQLIENKFTEGLT